MISLNLIQIFLGTIILKNACTSEFTIGIKANRIDVIVRNNIGTSQINETQPMIIGIGIIKFNHAPLELVKTAQTTKDIHNKIVK